MAEVPFRGGGFGTKPRRIFGVLSIALLLGLWWIGSDSGWISQIALPHPKDVLIAFRDLWVSGKLWDHLGASIYRLGLGWVFGTILGVAAGLAMGLSQSLRGALSPLVAALFPVPKIAMLPLFIVWFGVVGETSKVVTILFGSFFPTVINTLSGVDSVDRNLIRMGQSFGLSRWAIVRKIVLPGAMPSILSGMRISASISIVLLIAAEMIGAQYGVGAYILMAGANFALGQLIAGVMLLSALGLVVAAVIGIAEKRLLVWRG